MSPAIDTPPLAVSHPPRELPNAAADCVVVLTIIVAEAGEGPVISTLGVVPKEQLASELAPMGAVASAHFRLICPLKLPVGVTVIVESPEPPRVAMVTGAPERAKPAWTEGVFTVTATVAVAEETPEAAAVTVML
jgi:hypothetical protein